MKRGASLFRNWKTSRLSPYCQPGTTDFGNNRLVNGVKARCPTALRAAVVHRRC